MGTHTLSLQLSVECSLLRSALAVECRTLHIFHNSHKTNHLCSITPFSHGTERNTNSQPRHTGENRSGIALSTNISRSASLSIVQNRSKTKFCLINHLTTFSRYFHDIFTIFSLHHFSHLCQESCFVQRNNDIFTTDDMFTIFSRLTVFSGYFQDIF